MKRIVSVFLILCVIMSLMALAPLNASAESGEFTRGIYTYYVLNGEATITGCDESASGEIVIPSTLGGYPVTIIGDDAFFDCNSLTSIEIPDSITNIGNGAFYNCSSLTSIEIPDSITNIGNRAFCGCSSLTSIEIPDSITNIGDGAFYNCSSLTSIEIPDSITNIGDDAFFDCNSLTSIEIPDSITNIGNGAFYNCSSLTSIEIPDSITNIGDGAFYNCSSLTSIEIPDSITNIGNRAFCGCSSLTRIIIPDGIDNIGNEAFEGCDYLENVYYCGTTEEWNKYGVELSRIRCMGDYVSSGICGESITWSYDKYGTLSIDGNGEMYDYKKMDDEAAALDPSFDTYIPWNGYPILTYRIGEYVSKIDPYALFWCENIYVDDNNLNYCDIDGVLYSKNRETIVKYPTARRVTKVEIPYGVKNIGDFAFEGMDQVNEFVISDTVEHIGDKAFAFCRFYNILLPIRLKTIGGQAFYGCDRLTSIEIPDSVTRIGNLAFYLCENLSDISVGNNIEYIGRNAFAETEYATEILNWEDGILYIGSNLIATDNSYNKFSIKNGTICIASRAFENSIGFTVIIPESVKYIGDSCFFATGSEIYYDGSKNQFKQIIIGEDNHGLEYCFVHLDNPVTDTSYSIVDNEILLETKLPTADIISDSLFIVCGYNEKNKLNFIIPLTIDETVMKVRTTVPLQNTYKVKMFIWENFTTLKPITDVEVITIP